MRFVFLRRDIIRAPLSKVYEGPYRVLQQTTKTLRILKPSGEDTVSADRCKKAFLEPADEPQYRSRTTSPPHAASDPQPEETETPDEQETTPPPPSQSQGSQRPARNRQRPEKLRDYQTSAVRRGGGAFVAPQSRDLQIPSQSREMNEPEDLLR